MRSHYHRVPIFSMPRGCKQFQRLLHTLFCMRYPFLLRCALPPSPSLRRAARLWKDFHLLMSCALRPLRQNIQTTVTSGASCQVVEGHLFPVLEARQSPRTSITRSVSSLFFFQPPSKMFQLLTTSQLRGFCSSSRLRCARPPFNIFWDREVRRQVCCCRESSHIGARIWVLPPKKPISSFEE